MIGLSGIEYRIVILSLQPVGYSCTMDGPWWMKLLYDFGILQLYINRLVENGLIVEEREGWKYTGTTKGFSYVLKDSINREGNWKVRFK